MIPKIQASSLLKELGVKDLRGMDLEGIARFKDIYYQEMPMSGAQGRIIFTEKSAKITINTSITNIRQKRFVIAHELGHFSLHRNVKGMFNCDEKSFYDYHSKGGQEVEANEFAAELLMPSNLFKIKSQKLDFGIPVIQEMSEYFESSITATSIRYVEYGPKPIAMVFSQDSKVKWTKFSNNFPLKFINIKLAVPSTSVAAFYFNNYYVPEKPTLINAFDWFYNDFNIDKFNKVKIYEQCWPIKSLNAVISYLWFK